MNQILSLALLIILTLGQNYNETDAKRYANYSAIAHCQKKQIQAWNCKMCQQSTHLTQVIQITNQIAAITGFIGYDVSNNEIIISWRGTVDVRNWYEDFNFEFFTYDACRNCQIHAGFYQSYMSVHNRIQQQLNKLANKYTSAKFVITGHSLGAALATICALQLKKYFPSKIIKLYPLGSPRIGNVQLARFMMKQISVIMRIVHNRDIVPHLPPDSIGYFHTPYEVFYNEQMSSFKVCDDSGQDRTCSDKYAPDYSFADHDLYWVLMDDSIC